MIYDPITGSYTAPATGLIDTGETETWNGIRDTSSAPPLPGAVPEYDAITPGGRDLKTWRVFTIWGVKSFATEAEAIAFSEKYQQDLFYAIHTIGQNIVPGLVALGVGCGVKYALDHPADAKTSAEACSSIIRPLGDTLAGIVNGIGGIVPG